jgi:cyclohexadienyl dehydratase
MMRASSSSTRDLGIPWVTLRSAADGATIVPQRAVALLLLGLALAACRAPLRVGTSGDYLPFSTVAADGSPGGFDVEVAQAYASERGRRLEIERFRWSELEERLVAGDFDVAMSGVTVRGDRLARAPMTAAVARADAIVVVRPGQRAQDAATLDRAGTTIAVNGGGHLEKVARARFPHARILAIDDNLELPRFLASGRADAIVTDDLEARRFPGVGSVAGVLARDRKAYWVAPNEDALARDLNAWLVAREADGTLSRLRAQHLGSARLGKLPPGEERLVDLLARRLSLMPLVARAKRRTGSPIEDATREARIEESARMVARERGIAAERYVALVRAEVAAAKLVQRATWNDVGGDDASFDLQSELRPAIDRIDAAILEEIVRTAPIASSTDALADELHALAPLPGLDRASLDAIVVALRGIGPVAADGRLARVEQAAEHTAESADGPP